MSRLTKNDSSQAMQNLFSAYGGDDADADESKVEVAFSDDEELSDHSGTPTESKSTEKLQEKTTSEKSDQGEEQKRGEPALKKLKLERKVTATSLVSYGPDDQEGEEEEEEEEDQHASEDEMFSQFKSPSGVVTYNGTPMTPEELNDSLTKSLRHSLSEDDIQIPPEPPGSCSLRVQAKITKLYEKFQRTGKDMNAIIEGRKDFRNPSIYDKLIEYCSIDEKGTNYPPELFNPTIWSEDSTYEVLAQIQRAEMDKREKDRREKKDKALTVERVQGTKKPFTQPSNPSSPSGDPKRRTKWDSAMSAATSTDSSASVAKLKSFP